jgi:hypothetical protein
MTWTLEVNDSLTKISDRDDLRMRLTKLNEQLSARPTTAVLNAPDGACLYVGLGHRLSTLNYIAPGGWPAKHSVGSETEGLYTLLFAGQQCELPAECMIPFDMALNAALTFFDETELAHDIDWEDD